MIRKVKEGIVIYFIFYVFRDIEIGEELRYDYNVLEIMILFLVSGLKILIVKNDYWGI